MQLHAATLGGIKAVDRDTEEQSGSESRTGENLSDKVLTVGVFESVWQGGVKEWKCEWMVYVLVVKVQGYCIALDLTVLMLFFSTHSIQKCLMHLNESLAKDSSVTPNIATPKLQVKIHGFNWITEINGFA